jgi:hypothetical protein
MIIAFPFGLCFAEGTARNVPPGAGRFGFCLARLVRKGSIDAQILGERRCPWNSPQIPLKRCETQARDAPALVNDAGLSAPDFLGSYTAAQVWCNVDRRLHQSGAGV